MSDRTSKFFFSLISHLVISHTYSPIKIIDPVGETPQVFSVSGKMPSIIFTAEGIEKYSSYSVKV